MISAGYRWPLYDTSPTMIPRRRIDSEIIHFGHTNHQPDNAQNWVMPEPERREALIEELKIVRKTGLHRLRERIAELPELSRLATATMGAGTADDIERMLRHVFRSYAE